jgi:hypothetical protein
MSLTLLIIKRKNIGIDVVFDKLNLNEHQEDTIVRK